MRERSKFTVKVDFTFGALARIQIVHAIKCAQQSGLAATGGSNESRDRVLLDVQIDIFQTLKSTVVEVQIFDFKNNFFGSR